MTQADPFLPAPVPEAQPDAPPLRRPTAWGSRLSDRTVWIWLGLGLLALLAAIGFALWISAATPLHPVPVASRPTV